MAPSLCPRLTAALVTIFIVYSSDAFDGIGKYSQESGYRTFLERVASETDTQDVARSGGLDVDFNCPIIPPSPAVPTSVHRLRPADVNMVAALGDSITAGNGAAALTLLGCLFNYRGRSFSIGGLRTINEHVTIPNILKLYNPSLKGYSTGVCGYEEWCSHLNYAEAGAVSQDVYAQASDLINNMRNNLDVDFTNDWKIITLFIGGNDLCDYCTDTVMYSAQAYVQSVQRTLDLLHTEVPRVFVNVVQVVEVVEIAQVSGLVCNIMHSYLCDCAIDEHYQPMVHNATKEYQALLTELVSSGRYDTREDFTVVLQPFLENTRVPLTEDGDPDLSYFAPDCFHFSSKGHSAAALALWNNMLEPVQQKKTQWVTNEPFECPTEEQPYFYTMLNSVNATVARTPRVGDTKHDGVVQSPGSTSRPLWLIMGTTLTILGGVALLVAMVTYKMKSRINRKGEKTSLINNHEMIATAAPPHKQHDGSPDYI